ncbi:Nn.00g035550.m01.CDS01 [Neocucurbitaria sp. VM-36]
MPLPAAITSLKPRLQYGKADKAPSQSQSQTLAQHLGPETDSREAGELSRLRPSFGRPTSFQGDVDGSKRRSLLPQLGQPKYSSRLDALSNNSDREEDAKGPDLGVIESPARSKHASVTSEVKVHSAMPGRLRPRSMYQNGPTRSERPTCSNEKPLANSMLPPTPVSKPSESQTVALHRSQSLRKPGVVTQSAQPTGTAIHSRTQSVSATGPLRREPTKSNTSSERPKSLLVAPSSNLKTTSVPNDRPPNETKASTRIGHNRSASTRAKPEGLSGSARIATATRAEEHLVSHSRQRQAVPEEQKRIARPAFSTLQQHFTPRKTGKAPTATFLHPAPAPGANALPPETVNLQSELLQLHLLHEGSACVSSQWESSAKRHLHKKFEEAASLYQAMLEIERIGQEQKNLQSLFEWSAGKSSAGLIEYIQILSGPLHELPTLVEEGGRLQRVVSDFQHWISWVQEVQCARSASTEQKGSAGTIEGLGDSWKTETAGLIRKITSFARDLERIDQPATGSSIACIVDTCKSLLRGILDELHTIQTIEADVVTMEKGWVEDRLRAIAQDIGSYTVDISREPAAWRV